MRCLGADLAAVLVLAAVTPARAEEKDHATAFVMLAGFNVARAFHDTASDGMVFGVEASAVAFYAKNRHLKNPGVDAIPIDFARLVWGGLYAEALRDFGSDGWRVGIGPELGYSIVGVDGGLVFDFAGESRTGFVVRPVLTFAFATLYYRYGSFFDELPDKTFQELGVLIKVPLPVMKEL